MHHDIITCHLLSTPQHPDRHTSVAHTVETWGHGARNLQWLRARFILLGLALLGPCHAHWHTILTSSLTVSICPIFCSGTRFIHVQFRGCQGVPGRLSPNPIVRLVEMTSVPSTVVGSYTRLRTLRYVHSSALRAALYMLLPTCYCLHSTRLTAFGLAILQPLKFMTKFCLSDVDCAVFQAAASH
ncbi:hypothetical protein CGRA01v4_09039 [Colletotrichum graminicola]|nr:hypothetical protein CGRA01v4_09039 [Colletotrichum graminicola]